MLTTKNVITVYTKVNCPYCVDAKRLLNEVVDTFRTHIVYKVLNREEDETAYILWTNRLLEGVKSVAPGHRTFPWIFLGEEFLGGYSELASAVSSGSIYSLFLRNNLHLKDEDDDFF